jgi:YVTN family beta-propeller protein
VRAPGPRSKAPTRVALRRRALGLALAASCAGACLLAPAGSAQAAIPYTAYVGNYASGTLTPINTATNATSSKISVGSPAAIAITPDGTKAYVCNYDKGKPAGTVTPITLASGVAGSPVTVGAEPNSIAITPDGTKAYVSNYSGNLFGTVTVITLSSGATETIPVGAGPYSVAITPDGTKAYVANHFDGTVTPITIATNVAGTPIKVGAGLNLARTDWVAITPDGSKAYAANFATSEIVPITVATGTAGIAIKGVTEPNAIAITADGATAYIAEEGAPGHVVPMTLSNGKLGSPITVANNPYDVAITPDQASAYVADYNKELASFVTPISLQTNTPGTNIPGENGPDAVAITPDQAPVAAFTQAAAAAGSATSFDASASTVAYGSITSYAWNFGDGATATTSGPTTTHVYPSAGTYAVTLTETDAAGTSTTKLFNGRMMSLNGGPSAQTTRNVTVASAQQPPASILTALLSPNLQPASGDPAGGPPSAVVLSGRPVTITARGDALIGVSCPASARNGCRGTITIRLAEPRARRARAIAARCGRGCRPLGSAKYEARGGQKIRVRVHIASYGRRLLAHRKGLRVTVTATSAAGGRTTATVGTITLRARALAA